MFIYNYISESGTLQEEMEKKTWLPVFYLN